MAADRAVPAASAAMRLTCRARLRRNEMRPRERPQRPQPEHAREPRRCVDNVYKYRPDGPMSACLSAG